MDDLDHTESCQGIPCGCGLEERLHREIARLREANAVLEEHNTIVHQQVADLERQLGEREKPTIAAGEKCDRQS